MSDCPTPEYHETHRYCPSCDWRDTDHEAAEHDRRRARGIEATFGLDAALTVTRRIDEGLADAGDVARAILYLAGRVDALVAQMDERARAAAISIDTLVEEAGRE